MNISYQYTYFSKMRVFFQVLLIFVVFLCCTHSAFAKTKREVPFEKPLTVREAVLFALKANPSLGSSYAQSRASEEGRKAKIGTFGPKLGLVYSAMKQVRKSEPQATVTPEKGTYSFGVEVSQTVFKGFRLLADYQKAALQSQSDKLAVKKARLEIIEAVQSSFISYLRASVNCTSQKEAVDRLSEQREITYAFYKAGLKPKLDVLQADVDFREAQRVLLQIENTKDTELARLNTLLGLSASADIHYTGTLRYVPFTRSLEHCIEKAYSLRPDVVIAALAVAIAGKDKKAIQAGYYPTVEVYYNVTNSGNTPLTQKSGEYGSRYSSWEVGARATWDVFQWGTTYFADKQARELVTKMRYEEHAVRLQVGYDVKAKYLALKEAEKRISVAKAGVASAEEAYHAALARYKEQVGTGFDVLDTSSKVTSAKFSLSSAYADYLTALAQLYVAMGEEHPDILLS